MKTCVATGGLEPPRMTSLSLSSTLPSETWHTVYVLFTPTWPRRPASPPRCLSVLKVKSSFNPCPKRFRVSRVFDAGVSLGKTTQTVVQHGSPIVSLPCLSRLRGGYFLIVPNCQRPLLANQASQPQPCSAAPQSRRWQSSAESDSGGRCSRSHGVGRARP